MPSFSTDVPHGLGKEKAVERLKKFLADVAERFRDQVSKIDGTWNDNVLTFSLTTWGMVIKGDLTVDDDKASLRGQLPFAAIAFKGKIESEIKQELEKALA